MRATSLREVASFTANMERVDCRLNEAFLLAGRAFGFVFVLSIDSRVQSHRSLEKNMAERKKPAASTSLHQKSHQEDNPVAEIIRLLSQSGPCLASRPSPCPPFPLEFLSLSSEFGIHGSNVPLPLCSSSFAGVYIPVH